MGLQDRDYMRRDYDKKSRKAWRSTQDRETNLVDTLIDNKKRIMLGCIAAVVILAILLSLLGPM